MKKVKDNLCLVHPMVSQAIHLGQFFFSSSHFGSKLGYICIEIKVYGYKISHKPVLFNIQKYI